MDVDGFKTIVEHQKSNVTHLNCVMTHEKTCFFAYAKTKAQISFAFVT